MRPLRQRLSTENHEHPRPIASRWAALVGSALLGAVGLGTTGCAAEDVSESTGESQDRIITCATAAGAEWYEKAEYQRSVSRQVPGSSPPRYEDVYEGTTTGTCLAVKSPNEACPAQGTRKFRFVNSPDQPAAYWRGHLQARVTHCKQGPGAQNIQYDSEEYQCVPLRCP